MTKEQALDILANEILTEENTDVLIDQVLSLIKLPVWLRWLPLRSILDRLLPDVLINALRTLV